MSIWFIFALGAPLLWAFTNPIDAGLRQNYIKHDIILTWFVVLMRFIVAALLFVFLPLNFEFNAQFFLLLLSGAFWTFPLILYFRAMNFEEASRVVLLIQMLPVFVFLIAFFTLGEALDTEQFLAFLLILFGGLVASFSKLESKWHFSKAFYLILFACLMWGASDVLFKYLETSFENFLTAFVIYFLGGGLPSLLILLFPRMWPQMKRDFSALPLKGWVLLFGSAFIGLAGSACFAYALTLGKASLTAVFVGVQPLFAFLFGLILSSFIKEIPRERVDYLNLLLKFAALCLIFIGLLFLNF